MDYCFLMIDLVDHVSIMENAEPDTVEKEIINNLSILFTTKDYQVAIEEFGQFLKEKKFQEREELLLSLHVIHNQYNQDGKNTQ